jgi:hypothetical protein
VIKGVKIIYWFLIGIYLLFSVINLVEKDINSFLGGVIVIISALLIILFFEKQYKIIKQVDYSLPVIIVLKNAAKRLKPFNMDSLWLLIGLLIMDIGLSILSFSDISRLINIQIFFFGAVALGAFIGFIFWNLKYKSLRDNILDLISELENE